MGDVDDRPEPSNEDPVADLAARVDGLAGFAAGFPDSAAARVAAQQRNWPHNLSDTPLIIDTDIGGDPDDAVALCLAARHEPRLALVLTCDETTHETGGFGRRARAARWLLDACDRPEVPVVVGPSGDDTTQFVLDHLIPPDAAVPQRDVPAAVRAVAGSGDGRIRWLGIGPMTNLAALIGHSPDLAARLEITQMGGALAYRDPDRAEHNVRIDVSAAREILAAARSGVISPPEFVISDVTFTPEIAIADGDRVHTLLQRGSTRWAQVVAACLGAWFTAPRGYSASMQHDPLTLTAALGLPFVDSDRELVALDRIGRMTRHSDGAPVLLSRRADYRGFMRWLATNFDTPPDKSEVGVRRVGPSAPLPHRR